MTKQVFNPFLPLDEYIPDGEPHVFGDRIYLFGSHDTEGGKEYCTEGNYLSYSAPVTDLSDWRCDGEIYNSKQHPNSNGQFLYAPDVVRGNDGKFYLYYCLNGFDAGIHVAVCDTPCGKYEYLGYVKYPDGSKMMKFIPGDPAVINDNGVIRLYYGWSLSLVAAEANTGSAAQITQVPPEHLQPVEVQLFKRPIEDVKASEGGSLMGAVVCILDDDMLTVKTEPKRIIPGQLMAYGTDFQGHAFYEASSIRKIGDTYYFIYSSENSQELCYATSKSPDKDFKYCGTIISNGDVGYKGRTPEDRLNMTANNHGSIENINGKWYIFYHRQTHNSSYSRQACAEPIEILADGSIPQVEMTSCGLNDKPLKAEGEYPAVICCNLTNGKMPHITNRVLNADIPFITHDKNDRYITNIKDKTKAVYKYFDFDGKYELTATLRGDSGILVVSDGETVLNNIECSASSIWSDYTVEIESKGIKSLCFTYHGEGKADFLKFELKRK